MAKAEFIFYILLIVILISGFSLIGLLFYIGKTRIKEIDKAILGYEFPHDSIFALLVRVPNYSGGFMWKWFARLTGLEGKIEHFDSRFRWPFIASLVLGIVGVILIVIATILMKYLELEAS